LHSKKTDELDCSLVVFKELHVFSLALRKCQARSRLCMYLEELERRNLPSSVQPLPLVDTAYSTNWSGYAAETNLNNPASNAVTEVSGAWTVPTVTGSTNAYSSVWVGIDGYSSSTVEQIGTEQDTLSFGATRYYAWWEMYPNPSVQITSMTIRPGDTISASVTYNSGIFTLQITDNTTGGSFTTTQAATAQRSSGEWIVEAPSSISGILPLANFGTANFSAAQATISGAPGAIDNAAWQNTSIDMVTSSGTLLDQTSGLTDTSNTSSFSVMNTGGGGSGGHLHGHGHGPNDAIVFALAGQPDFQAPAISISSQTAESPTASAGQNLMLPAAAAAVSAAQVDEFWSRSEPNTEWGALQSGLTDEASAWEQDA
jgi:Peptidase A4 family